VKHAVVALLLCAACARPTVSEPASPADLSASDAQAHHDLGPDATVVLDKGDLANPVHVDLAEAPDLAIDYCNAAHGGCSPHATCTQSGTTPACACNAGYTGDGLSCSAPATSELNEGFDDITTLTTWTQQNSSDPVGALGWFQGDTDNFSAFDGAGTSYISANFNDVDDEGTISNWLATPPLTFGALATLAFYTRKVSPDDFADRIEVRLCTTMPCTPPTDTGVGSYTTLLGAVNPNLVLNVYPTTWTQLAYDNTTLPWSGQGRVAIRYYVTDGGLDGHNGDTIGVDRFTAAAGTPAYAVRGTTSGLVGTVTLELNGLVSLAVTTNGAFDFGKNLDTGTPYVVTVAVQPSGHTCVVASGSGTIAAADIANVAVTCQ
jgi:hypothetical protein